MPETFSIVMPAYRAEGTIVAAAGSILAQTYPDWTLVIVADDGADYEAVLGRAGLSDSRFTFLTSGKVKGGASNARNVGLDTVSSPLGAILDADDRMKPDKLAKAAAVLEHYPIVSTAIDVMDHDFNHLRYVGAGPDRQMPAGEHKWTNFSMDSMIAWDRRRTEARYDPVLPNMTDLDFLIRLGAHVPGGYHLGAPLHDYIKVPTSMSNAAGFTERMLQAKRLILERLGSGYYPLADEGARAGIMEFLEVSLTAEAAYPAVLARNPAALFEDTIEPLLATRRAAATRS